MEAAVPVPARLQRPAKAGEAMAVQAAYLGEKLSYRITACQKLRKQDD